MEFGFIVEAKLVLNHEKGWTTSKHVRTDFILSPSPNLDKKMYFKGDPKEHNLTKEGAKVASNVLVSALAANIHQAHQNGDWDSAEHMRYVIQKLEEQFANVANVSKGTM